MDERTKRSGRGPTDRTDADANTIGGANTDGRADPASGRAKARAREDKRDRLAAALRDNLRRRKAQARGRTASGPKDAD